MKKISVFLATSLAAIVPFTLLFLSSCNSHSKTKSFAELFVADSSSYGTYVSMYYNSRLGEDGLQSLELKRDTTFVLTTKLYGYGMVTFKGKWNATEMVDMHDKYYSDWKKLIKDTYLPENTHEFGEIHLEFENNISSADAIGNAAVGIPYKLRKPGTCGARNYVDFGTIVYVTFADDNYVLVVDEKGCQEQTAKPLSVYRKMTFSKSASSVTPSSTTISSNPADPKLAQANAQPTTNEVSQNVSPSATANPTANGTSKAAIPFASRLLVESDLSGMSKSDLKLLRNEIYARHGYIFSDAKLSSYFKSKEWYRELSHDVSASLNATEKANAEFIRKHE